LIEDEVASNIALDLHTLWIMATSENKKNKKNLCCWERHTYFDRTMGGAKLCLHLLFVPKWCNKRVFLILVQAPLTRRW